jgi:hypothetical protein
MNASHRVRAALFVVGILVAEVFAAWSHLHRFGLVVLLATVSVLIAGVWSKTSD